MASIVEIRDFGVPGPTANFQPLLRRSVGIVGALGRQHLQTRPPARGNERNSAHQA